MLLYARDYKHKLLSFFCDVGRPPLPQIKTYTPTYSARRIAIVREAVIKVVTPHVPLSIHDETFQKNTNPHVYNNEKHTVGQLILCHSTTLQSIMNAKLSKHRF